MNESRDTRAKMRNVNLFLSLKTNLLQKNGSIDKNAWKYPWGKGRGTKGGKGRGTKGGKGDGLG